MDYAREVFKIMQFYYKQEEIFDAVKRLRVKGFSWIWLYEATKGRIDKFNEKGLGLLFTASYQEEVTSRVNDIEKNQDKLVKQYDEMKKNEKVITVKINPETLKPKRMPLYDIEALYRI